VEEAPALGLGGNGNEPARRSGPSSGVATGARQVQPGQAGA
jgi:hypothetical protein